MCGRLSLSSPRQRIGAKIRGSIVAMRVMPGLVPGIHAVRRHDGF
jgi:hypothetical protein